MAFQKFTNILNLSFPEALSILETKYSGLDRSLHDRKFIPGDPNVPRPYTNPTVMPVMVPSLPAPIVTPKYNPTPQINGAVSLPNSVMAAAHIPHSLNCPPIDVGGGLKLEYYTKEINPKRKINVRLSDRFHTSAGKVSTYDMRSTKRGVLFLVNIINFEKKPTITRNGATVDRDNLINLFRQMHFQIIYYEDITKAVRILLI